MCVPEQKLAPQPQQQYRLPPREYGGTWQHSASLRRPEPSVSCPGTISGISKTCRFLGGGVPPGSNSAAYPGLVGTRSGVFEDAGYAWNAEWMPERRHEFPGINVHLHVSDENGLQSKDLTTKIFKDRILPSNKYLTNFSPYMKLFLISEDLEHYNELRKKRIHSLPSLAARNV